MAGTSKLRQDVQAATSSCLQVSAQTSCSDLTCILILSACAAGRVVGLNHDRVLCCQTREDPALSLLSPRLRQEWDIKKNQHLGKSQIKPNSHKVLAWICLEGTADDPHCCDAQVYSRTRGTGCPYCAGVKVSKGNSLATVVPDVAKSWCYKKSKGTPQDYTSGSGYKATWNCAECGNQWSTAIVQRVSKSTGCPKCYSRRQGRRKDGSRRKLPTFADCNHPLLDEWDYSTNAKQDLFPKDITLGSHKPVHWVCRQCSRSVLHRWVTTPNARTSNQRGCPHCSRRAVCKCNSLAALFPEVAQEWDYSKNKAGPGDYTAQSHERVWWQTVRRGSWQQSSNEEEEGFYKFLPANVRVQTWLRQQKRNATRTQGVLVILTKKNSQASMFTFCELLSCVSYITIGVGIERESWTHEQCCMFVLVSSAAASKGFCHDSGIEVNSKNAC